MQDLKGKIILKGKRIGYLEDSLNGQPDEVPEWEDVEEEEGPETEEETLRNEEKKKEKVYMDSLGGQLFCVSGLFI